MTSDLQKFLREIRERYPKTIDDLLLYLSTQEHAKPLIGETADKTLEKVYRREGALQLIADLRQIFINL